MRKLNSQQRRIRNARIRRNTTKLNAKHAQKNWQPNITPMTKLHLDKDVVFNGASSQIHVKPEVKEEVVLQVQSQEAVIDSGTNAASA